jgi:hypothetical protein
MKKLFLLSAVLLTVFTAGCARTPCNHHHLNNDNLSISEARLQYESDFKIRKTIKEHEKFLNFKQKNKGFYNQFKN